MPHVVLITGASRGLGRAFALAFGKKKYAVAVNYATSEKEARATQQDIVASGGEAEIFKADVGEALQAAELIRSVQKKWGKIDVLINNAGVVRNQTIAKMTDAEWRDPQRVILDGTFFCTRAAIPIMRDQKGGVIINIASYVADRPARGTANYSAAKAGVVALTRATAVEEGRFNIRALAVLPGFHVTDMNKDVWAKYQENILDNHLMRKLPETAEMAEFVVNLAELKSVTGQVYAFESRV